MIAFEYVGALIATFLLTRLANWILRRCKVRPWGWSHAIVAALSVLGGAYGFSRGGEMAWEHAAMIYLPAVAVWLVVDFFAERGRRAREAEAS